MEQQLFFRRIPGPEAIVHLVDQVERDSPGGLCGLSECSGMMLEHGFAAVASNTKARWKLITMKLSFCAV